MPTGPASLATLVPNHPILQERADLCALFAEVGPDAPTWCGEWTTHDLAAHLRMREHRLDAGPGLVAGGVFARHTERVQKKTARRPYDALVADLRSGPPVQWPGRWAPDFDVHEWFVHHEDVRRPAGGAPRTDLGALEGPVWAAIGRFGKQLTRPLSCRVRVVSTDGREQVIKDAGDGEVVLTGPTGDLILRLFGRPIEVDVSGDDAAVDAFQRSDLGI